MVLIPRVMEMLKKQGLEKLTVILGGTVPPRDVPTLQAMGVAEVFGPGSSLQRIVDFVQHDAVSGSPER